MERSHDLASVVAGVFIEDIIKVADRSREDTKLPMNAKID